MLFISLLYGLRVQHLILQVIKNDVSNMETMHIFNHACKPIIFLFLLLLL